MHTPSSDFSSYARCMMEEWGEGGGGWRSSWAGFKTFKVGTVKSKYLFFCHLWCKVVAIVWRLLGRLSAVVVALQMKGGWRRIYQGKKHCLKYYFKKPTEKQANLTHLQEKVNIFNYFMGYWILKFAGVKAWCEFFNAFIRSFFFFHNFWCTLSPKVL